MHGTGCSWDRRNGARSAGRCCQLPKQQLIRPRHPLKAQQQQQQQPPPPFCVSAKRQEKSNDKSHPEVQGFAIASSPSSPSALAAEAARRHQRSRNVRRSPLGCTESDRSSSTSSSQRNVSRLKQVAAPCQWRKDFHCATVGEAHVGPDGRGGLW